MSGEGDYNPTKDNEDTDLDCLLDNDSDDAEDTNLPPPPQPDRTQPFTPGVASTPYQPQGATAGPYHGGEANEMSNLNLNDEFTPDDIPPVEVDYIDADEKEKLIEQEKKVIKNKFRNVDFK